MNLGDEYIYIYIYIYSLYTNHKNKRAKEPKRIRTVEMNKTWGRLPEKWRDILFYKGQRERDLQTGLNANGVWH